MTRTRFALFAGLLSLLACNETPVTDTPVAPQVQIVEPDDADAIPEFVFGESVSFVAYASDDEDPEEALTALWTTSWTDTEGNQHVEELGTSAISEDGRIGFTTTELGVAVHTVQVEVTDSDGLTAYSTVKVQIRAFDEAPTVQITAPAEGATFDQYEPVNFAATATDDGDLTALEVRWESDQHVSPLDATPPAANGAIQFQTDELVPGEHTITVTVTDGAEQSHSDTVAITVVAENLPPSMPSVGIDPLGADTEDDLTCVASGSVDPEGELVTYEYAWEVNGASYPWTGQVIDADDTERDDEWTCLATPVDPQGLAGDTGFATVIVGNTLPSFTSVVLSPIPAYEDTTLECAPSGWFDPDGDPEGALHEWWIGGVQSAATGAQLTGADFDHFDEVTCVAIPWDGANQGNPLTSNTVTIENTPPLDPTVELVPLPLHVDEDLECLVTNPDPDVDGDAVTYEIRWSRDGTVESLLIDPVVPSSETALGEEWTCEIRAHDGTEDSDWVTASTHVVPYEGDLVITELMVAPEAVDDGAGEYVEIHNVSNETIPLDGFVLHDGGADYHAIASGGQAHVTPGDFFVLGINANPATNGGVIVDYQYAGIALDEAPDGLQLEFLGILVDAVSYDWGAAFPAPEGAALSLDPGHVDALDNDDGTLWCVATTPLYEWGDFGTPGTDNDSCACSQSDLDGDGFGSDASCPADYVDCDDGLEQVNPAAFDICADGIDQDCDGADRECTCAEADADGDGYGTTPDCPIVDCDDTNIDVFPGAPETCNGVDDDCDGTVDDGYDNDADGWTTCAGDCNDGNDEAYPGAAEICDGVDNDCNGQADEEGADDCEVYYEDLDADGYGAGVSMCLCYPDAPYTSPYGTDCDELNANVHPGATESCNSLDDDCDGDVDEGFDTDGDSWTTCAGDCDDTDADTYPLAPEICDGLDNDCNLAADEDVDAIDCVDFYLDADDDNYGITGDSQCWCQATANYRGDLEGDCNDGDPAIHPTATEICNNVDDDCNGNVDDGVTFTTYFQDADGDGHGNAASSQSTCDGAPVGDWALTDDDCDDTDPLNYPGNVESCDGEDNDCDGLVDDGVVYVTWYHDGDGDGHGDPADSETQCSGPPGVDWVQVGDDCDDGDAANHPDNTEICDLQDNDCDGNVDEGLDGDGDGYTECAGDCNDGNAVIYPYAPEICDGLNNDCDNEVDEGQNGLYCATYYMDADGDTYGDGSDSQCLCDPDYVNGYDAGNGSDCDDGDAAIHPGAAEECDGVDNNCAGGVDEGQGNPGCTTYYRDVDGDGYGNAADSQCLCDEDAVNDYDVTNNNDCYDYNDDAKPNQTSYFSSHRGDGSHDYNCNGADDKRWTDTAGSCSFVVDVCGADDGWSGGIPDCGSIGTWASGCYYDANGWPWEWGCVWSSVIIRTQTCR